ncbi:helix-turn-helix transcriptional regulator [Geminicoccus roseus]|uniref:helix-turn-helix transcriptional regulator n=1 Tax=Geminicoccus roseus TaxID=404900 RepID=UPI000427F3FB|nr:helix-turn-helix transcriptional regulator [Geminicoccus roseus]
MAGRTLACTRGELSEFLVRHRARLSPAEIGLPHAGRRRTAGLRREEVAQIAGVGLTWYTWFEQGRDIQVSESFLLRIARALRLDDAECCHLFLLAHRRPPPLEPAHWPTVTPLIQQLLHDLTLRPAYVLNLRWDVVAWNAAADRLFGFAGRDPAGRNFLRMVVGDPGLRRRLPAWPEDASRLIAQFQRDLASAPDDPAMRGLIEQLESLAPEAGQWIRQPGLVDPGHGIGSLLDPDGRRVDFQHETLTVDEHRHLRMIVYFEAPRRLGGSSEAA